MTNLNDIASKSLGDSTSYAIYTDTVDKTLLNPMPRLLARQEHKIIDSPHGFDIWHAWESTFINKANGMPVSGVLKIKVPSSSEFIVESKSLKLYLNTFDMCKLSGVEEYEKIVQTDLSELLQCDVECKLHVGDLNPSLFNSFLISSTATNLDTLNIVVDSYNGDYEIPRGELTETSEYHSLYTPSLRSRCRHTKQKDSGCVLISLHSKSKVSYEEIYKFIISLREVNEFHEFCAEKIYTAIKKAYECELAVYCFYVRRGGIDISPCRYDKEHNFSFTDVEKLCKGYYYQ